MHLRSSPPYSLALLASVSLLVAVGSASAQDLRAAEVAEFNERVSNIGDPTMPPGTGQGDGEASFSGVETTHSRRCPRRVRSN
jgi:hypothetical protein